MKILIIGGVAGGATAAARMRRNDETAEIVMVERGPYMSFANCGLPYHISGIIPEREQLLVTSENAFEKRYGVDVRCRTEALAIDRAAKNVRMRDLETGQEYDEPYDRLLLSPGAEPFWPPLPGIDSPRVFGLRNIPDLDRIMAFLEDKKPRRAVVIGGGFIGVEVAENLHERGLFTTIVEGADQILTPLDYEMAAIVHAQLQGKGIALHLADRTEKFEDKDDQTILYLTSGKRLQADLVIMAIGVRPETTLARAAGLELGETGGIRVNKYMQTSDTAIYAVGDAIEVTQTVNGKPALIPLAGPANRQARMAADNIISGKKKSAYRGTQGTAVIKAFDLCVAMTGMNGKQLRAAQIEYLSTIVHSGSHASYYPGAMPISLKVLYSPDGKILGAQAIGADGADKRIDVIATAMQGGLNVTDLSELELAYAPPFGAAKDPVNIAGYVAENTLNGTHPIVDWREVSALAPDEAQLLDVRTDEEFDLGTISGAIHIPLDVLRQRLDELDREKPVIVFCQVGLRGYLATRILMQNGFKNVRNLTGGYKSYVWATEKLSNPDLLDFESIKPLSPEDIEADGAECFSKASTGEVNELNVVGLQCPGPIMKTYRAMEALETGEVLNVTASDPAFGRDVRSWAKKMGHDLLSVDTDKGFVKASIRKGEAPVPATAEGGVLPAKNKMTLVVFSSDIDKVMASLIIANGALAMGKTVSVFFTFWGLNVLRRPDAPALPKPFMDKMFGAMMPAGAGRLDSISKMNFAGMGAQMIRHVMNQKGVETPAQLLKDLVAGGARLTACQMSMDVMGIREEELIDGVEMGGVAVFLDDASESETTLFI